MIEQRIYERNGTGHKIEVVSFDHAYVSFYKLHGRNRIGSIVRERINKFLVRYA